MYVVGVNASYRPVILGKFVSRDDAFDHAIRQPRMSRGIYLLHAQDEDEAGRTAIARSWARTTQLGFGPDPMKVHEA